MSISGCTVAAGDKIPVQPLSYKMFLQIHEKLSETFLRLQLYFPRVTKLNVPQLPELSV
jgi:hypothetical protein